MFCRSCQYGLVELDTRRCPECGRAFDPADPRTYQARRRGLQGLLGLGLSVAMAIAMVLAFWVAMLPGYGEARHAAFATVLGTGLVCGLVAAGLAAWNRSWLGRIPLLLVGVLSVWLGLFLGSEKYFRVWQSSPNASDEAFADTAPLGALLGGWIPGVIVVGVAFVISGLAFEWHRRRGRPKTRSS